MPDLMNNCLRLRPFVFYVCHPPSVKGSNNPVNDLLLLAGFGEVHATLFIETGEDLFQSIDGIILDVMANLLGTIESHIRPVDKGRG